MMLPRLYKQRSLWASAGYHYFYLGSYIVLLYYLPIYFQSVLDASPIRSGVNNLPLVLSAAAFALVGGAVVTITGRAQQVMFAGAVVTTVAMGLIYTLDLDTSQSNWIGSDPRRLESSSLHHAWLDCRSSIHRAERPLRSNGQPPVLPDNRLRFQRVCCSGCFC